MVRMVNTTIVNATSHTLHIRDGNAGVYGDRTVPSMRNYIFDVDPDPNATYREIAVSVGNHRLNITSEDLSNCAEITVYETPTQEFEWRVSKMRRNTWDSAAFDAVRKDASSRMKSIETSYARLVMLSKQVKICPAQCENLVQTCLEGVKEMKAAYDKKSEDHMWRLYNSRKLLQLISSLDKLLSNLGSIQDLLQACGSNWCSMALVVSLPLPPPERIIPSKFDILTKELHWNLETIHYALHLNHYALHLNRGVEFEWNERKSRYALERIAEAEVTVPEGMELEQSRRLASADREHLLSELENGSILVPGNPLLYYLWWHSGFKFATYHWRDKLAVELQKRLKETTVLSNDSSSIPDCFWINSADLKLREQLYGDPNSKSVWKGEWCGQAVAIGITKNAEKEDLEKEAGLMLKVQHPNIVGFLGCAFTEDAPPPMCSGEDDKCSAGYLVMELMQENLWHVIRRCAKSHFGNPFPLAVTVDILLQIAEAMVHMHNLDIIHRDLKSANCLVNRSSSSNSESLVLKLIDFELSKELDPNAPISNHTVKRGTLRLMAPEVWGAQISAANSSEMPYYVPYAKSADVWSFGMTCYEVITGKLPFHESRSTRDLVKALRDGKRPSIPASVSCPEGLKALMSRCWAQEPSDRPDFKDIKRDLWTIKYEIEIQ